MADIEWISEADRLPRIGQDVLVLVATPCKMGDFWDIRVGSLLVRHEDVVPLPVKPGDQWPVDFHWSFDQLVTGNGWWASMTALPLPPNAKHETIRGYHCIVQVGEAFV